MSFLNRLLGKTEPPKQRVQVCVECGMPVADHKQWCSILRGQDELKLKGELIEHSSLCAVTFLHRTGEVSYEWGKGYDHWFENKSGGEVVLTSSDVIPPDFFDPGSEHLKQHTH